MRIAAVDAGLNEAKAKAAKLKPASASGTPLELAHDAISPDPNQPRRAFDETAMNELAASIKEQGIIQPIIVCMVGGGYQLIAGERRWRAAKLAGLVTVPVIVREPMTDYAQVIENEQRENLTALELAEFIGSKYQDGKGESLTTIAKKLGKSKAVISQYNSLNTAPDAVRDAMESGKLTSSRTANDLIKLYETYDAEQVGKLVEAVPYIGRSDVTRMGESLASLSRQTPVKKSGKKRANLTGRNAAKNTIESISKTDAEIIRELQPAIAVTVGRRHGRIAFNRLAKSELYTWVLFDDMPSVVEQVKCSILKISVIGFDDAKPTGSS